MMSLATRRSALGPATALSLRRQCELLGLSRGGLYYETASETPLNLTLMSLIDAQYTKAPFYGSRRIAASLLRQGHCVNRKRVQRLMRVMGIEAIYQKPRTSRGEPLAKKYPYLLSGLAINHPNQVWGTDITYIRMPKGFLYLVAILDWHSRYVLSWELSNTLESTFCIEALQRALQQGRPEIFNSDQGCQFTSREFTGVLLGANILISMDGRGRAFDNIFTERLWRTFKYEEVYLNDYENGMQAFAGIDSYWKFYNNERLHQSLKYRTPREVHFGNKNDKN